MSCTCSYTLANSITNQSWAPVSWFTLTHHRVIDAKAKSGRETRDAVSGIKKKYSLSGDAANIFREFPTFKRPSLLALLHGSHFPSSAAVSCLFSPISCLPSPDDRCKNLKKHCDKWKNLQKQRCDAWHDAEMLDASNKILRTPSSDTNVGKNSRKVNHRKYMWRKVNRQKSSLCEWPKTLFNVFKLHKNSERENKTLRG